MLLDLSLVHAFMLVILEQGYRIVHISCRHAPSSILTLHHNRLPLRLLHHSLLIEPCFLVNQLRIHDQLGLTYPLIESPILTLKGQIVLEPRLLVLPGEFSDLRVHDPCQLLYLPLAIFLTNILRSQYEGIPLECTQFFGLIHLIRGTTDGRYVLICRCTLLIH